MKHERENLIKYTKYIAEFKGTHLPNQSKHSKRDNLKCLLKEKVTYAAEDFIK